MMRPFQHLIRAAALGLAVMLSGCASPSIERYAQEKPAMDLAQYFQGKTTGYGMVTNRSGEVTRRFVVKIEGRFANGEGTLDERFDWSDGEKQRRVWRLKQVGPQQWEGRADDVVGFALGDVRGNALHWRYVLALPNGNSTVEVNFDDWMYMIDQDVMINRARFSKFGIDLGEVLLSFRKG